MSFHSKTFNKFQEGEIFKEGADHSDDLVNHGRQKIEFFHIPSSMNVGFKAFLTEFSDEFSSEWESTTTFGRMDPIQTFSRTGRRISIAFDVVAGSLEEARSNMEKISLLIMMLYPSYERSGGATTMKGSPYFKLGFMNLAQNQTPSSKGEYSTAQSDGLLGTLEGFSYSPNLDAGMYFESVGGASYPKVVNISTGLTVLHQHVLGWEQFGGAPGAFAKFPYGKQHPNIRDISALPPPKMTDEESAKLNAFLGGLGGRAQKQLTEPDALASSGATAEDIAASMSKPRVAIKTATGETVYVSEDDAEMGMSGAPPEWAANSRQKKAKLSTSATSREPVGRNADGTFIYANSKSGPGVKPKKSGPAVKGFRFDRALTAPSATTKGVPPMLARPPPPRSSATISAKQKILDRAARRSPSPMFKPKKSYRQKRYEKEVASGTQFDYLK